MNTKTKKPSKAVEFLENLIGSKLTLGNFLQSIRLCDEQSLTDFAKLLGISRQYLCDVENGRRFLSPKAASNYAKKLGYSEIQFVRLCFQDMLDRDQLDLEIDIKKAA